MSFNMDVDGVILWSTSMNMKNRCDGIGEYMEKYLGLTVQELLQLNTYW